MHGSFLTSKIRISILNFMQMQRDQVKIDALTMERELKKQTGSNWTYANARAALKQPRRPPTTSETTCTFLTTYAMFLEMLFTDSNSHLEGLNAIRRKLRIMQATKRKISKIWFATVVWGLIED